MHWLILSLAVTAIMAVVLNLSVVVGSMLYRRNRGGPMLVPVVVHARSERGVRR